MQFKATALMAIVAIGSSPVVAAPAPADLALPRPYEMKEGQPVGNGLRKAGNAVTDVAVVCVSGVVACMWVIGEETKRGKCCKEDPSGKGSTSGKDKSSSAKPTTGKRDVSFIDDIVARSTEPEADYIHVVTRDTIEETAAEETAAEETADEEAAGEEAAGEEADE